MPRRCLVLAAILAAPLSHAPAAEVTRAVVTLAPNPADDRPGVRIDDGECERYVSLVDVPVAWHLEPTVPVPITALRPGTRVRITGDYWAAEWVEIVSLGRWGMEAAVEEWVVEATAGRADKVLTTGQTATLDALASPAWLVRDATTRALQDRGMDVLRLLVWGRHARDQEVRARCEAMLKRLGWER